VAGIAVTAASTLSYPHICPSGSFNDANLVRNEQRVLLIGSWLLGLLAVAAVATFIPAIRAARASTVRALADSARPPRRMALNAVSIAVTATGIVGVLMMVHAAR
jgi:hypothetical protein